MAPLLRPLPLLAGAVVALAAGVAVLAQTAPAATVPPAAGTVPPVAAPESPRPPEAALGNGARDATGATLDGAALAVTLVGKSVRGPEGDELGTVEDMLLDRDSGEIRAVVIGTGGFLGLGERLVQVPWNKAQYDPNADQLVVALNGEEVAALPAFDYGRLDQGTVGLADR